MNKKVHFYFPKKKIDVENQTFFDDYEHERNNENIYNRQYQSALNTLFDLEEPENEIEKMIKSDYSSRISFYMTNLHDDRFEPLTPSKEIFSNASPKICLEIRNDGFIIWNCINQFNGSNQIFRSDQARYLALSFDNDSDVIYLIIQSFITGRINFPLLRIVDQLQIPYDSSGTLLCEIADFRFDPNLTCMNDFDESGVSRKRIVLRLSNSSIYYLFTRAKQAFIRKKSVHLNISNNENHSSNSDSKVSRSISSIGSVPNISTNPQQNNPSTINAISDSSFNPIKKNDSTPNLMISANISQLNPSNQFNPVRCDSLPLNKFQNEQNKMIINIPNQPFITDSNQNPINIQMQNIDQSITLNNPMPSHFFKENSFQIPIQSMNSKLIQSENSQQQIQTQLNKQQSKQKQQHSQQQKQQQQQQQQQTFQHFSSQPQVQKTEIIQSSSIKQEETTSKTKSKTNSSNLTSSSSPQMNGQNAIYEAEANLILLLHPTVCTDPSPDVCRVSSILDFRKKMWSETPSVFMNNYDQMKSRINQNVHINTVSHRNYQINPPSERIMIPDTISQMFISKNMAIEFTTY